MTRLTSRKCQLQEMYCLHCLCKLQYLTHNGFEMPFIVSGVIFLGNEVPLKVSSIALFMTVTSLKQVGYNSNPLILWQWCCWRVNFINIIIEIFLQYISQFKQEMNESINNYNIAECSRPIRVLHLPCCVQHGILPYYDVTLGRAIK